MTDPRPDDLTRDKLIAMVESRMAYVPATEILDDMIWPIIVDMRSSEHQAGRLQGREEERAATLKLATVTQNSLIRCPNCASLQVNVDDGDWTCKGCGAHGDYRSTFGAVRGVPVEAAQDTKQCPVTHPSVIYGLIPCHLGTGHEGMHEWYGVYNDRLQLKWPSSQ